MWVNKWCGHLCWPVSSDFFAEHEHTRWYSFTPPQWPNMPPPLTDREALAALYNATGREKWLSDAPLSEWDGVKTDDDGRVIKLDHSYRELRGEIPAELGSLSNLTELNLGDNNLSGEIPAELGSLSKLVSLGLSNNELSGCVPSSLEDDLLFWGFSNLGGLPFC